MSFLKALFSKFKWCNHQFEVVHSDGGCMVERCKKCPAENIYGG